MTVKDLIASGKLYDAVALLTAEVQKNPQDISQRNILWELLCIAGEWERADQQLDILALQDTAMLMRTKLYRWLIRAEQSRWDCFNQGALPEFIHGPTPVEQNILKALIERRSGNMEKAAKILEETNAIAPLIEGKCNNKDFSEFRDGDDWCAFFLEALTSQGQYYWIPWQEIAELKVDAPKYPIDLIWRKAYLSLNAGIDGEVYLPTIYIDTPKERETAKMGYQTDWIIKNNQPVSGIGQRIFMAGQDEIPIMEIEQITIER